MTLGKVVIIGAGLSGLAAGCYARMNDHHATILEQLGWPGGLARSWDRDGFRMDPGPDLIWGYGPGTSTHDLLRELGVLPRRGISPLDRWEFVDEKGSRRVNLTAPLEELESQFKSISPEDNDLIEDLIDAASTIDPVELLDSLESMPSDLGGLTSSLSERWRTRKYLRYLRGPWSAPIVQWSERFHDPFLQQIISSLTQPEAPAWLGISTLSLAAKGGLGRLDEGSDGLVHDLLDRFRKLGGDVEFRSLVSKIVVEGDEVKGVRLSDGRQEPADVVISASDGKEVIYGMLDGKFLDEEIERRYRVWKPSCPRVSISIGTRKPFEGQVPLQTILLDKPLVVGTTPNLRMTVRSFASKDGYAPPGKALMVVTLDSDWQFWYKLRALDRGMYEEEKVRVGGEVVSHMEGLYPSISMDVELIEVSTPFTTWKTGQTREGAPSGWSITSDALSARPTRTLPGLKGFYMAGPWAVPALGALGCLFTGKHAVHMMCQDQGRAFKAIAPRQ